jgi:dynein heavy chain
MAQCPQGEGGVKMKLEDRRWLIFDGPVDAVWIENMNTVLDDNKKLCLMSSEVIAMTPGMSMIFEPMDLAEASPATVSRCGMVYLQPHEMGWQHLYLSWKKNLPATFNADQVKVLDNLVEIVVQPTIDNLRSEQKEEAPTEDQNLVVSMLRILRAMLQCFDDEAHYNSLDKKQVAEVIEHSFLMSCIWSLCMSVRTECRKPLDLYFKKVVNGEVEGLPKLKNKIKAPFFDRGAIYDYCYIPDANKWQHWMDFTNKEDIDKFPKGSIVNELVVTTPETIKYGYMQEFFITNDIRSLFVGPTGTGKTKYIQNVLNQKLEASKWLIIEIGFSAQTHCNMVQDIVDMKIEKRRRDTFGPRFGTRCVVYVDDLNMPKLEKYGAQPPVEILRQMVDGGGWYDRKDNKHPFRNIVDTMVVASMGTPGGGKSFITPRFQRHFNIVAFANFDENSLNTIFRNILKWHFREGGFSPDVAGLEQKIVQATFKIYEKIQ